LVRLQEMVVARVAETGDAIEEARATLPEVHEIRHHLGVARERHHGTGRDRGGARAAVRAEQRVVGLDEAPIEIAIRDGIEEVRGVEVPPRERREALGERGAPSFELYSAQ